MGAWICWQDSTPVSYTHLDVYKRQRHDSARLLRRAERAAAEGRDLLAEYAADLRRRINEKLVERDVLETQLEEMEQEGVELSACLLYTSLGCALCEE